ncbi:hypothetical protein PspLS_01472 [Pyricularia sp. CBS 133598]|nr:hypothetical protein PspLS_01472 [Pyricularia sp. CBS 133598]
MAEFSWEAWKHDKKLTRRLTGEAKWATTPYHVPLVPYAGDGSEKDSITSGATVPSSSYPRRGS